MATSAIDPATVAMIFRTLRGRFGSPFVDRYRSGVQDANGKDVGLLETMDVWAHELRDLSSSDIKHGLQVKFKFPPSCDEFAAACCKDRNYETQANRNFKALPAPTIDKAVASAILRDLAEKRLGSGGMLSARELNHKIADQVARGVYCGGLWCTQMTADYLQSIGELPEHMERFLTKRRAA